ncbi:MAG: hypothetical protein V2B19_32030 [Pseudomonadota bacterium]
MPTSQISEDLIGMLRILKQEGGTDCTGTCHHRKAGEFHCHTLGNVLNISSQGVKNRLLKLLHMGLVQRNRIERADSTMLVRFTITPLAEEVLSRHEQS